MRRTKPASPPVDLARLEHVPLGQLRGWERNPKQHDLSTIRRSFERFGFVLPLVEDSRTGRLVAGHGRLELLLLMRDAGEQPPRRIIVDESGDWLVPVLRGVSFDDEREAEAYIIADNKTSENGGWNDVILRDILGDLDLDTALATGFSDDELARLLEPPAVASPSGGNDPWKAGGGGGAAGTEDGYVKFLFGNHSGRVSVAVYASFVEEYKKRRADSVLLDDVLAAWIGLKGGA